MVLNYIWIAFFLIAFVTALMRLVFLGDTQVFPELPHEFNFLWQCLGEYEYIAYYPVDSPDGVLNVFVYNKNN